MKSSVLRLFVLNFIDYLFGCVGSQLWHPGSSQHHAGSFVAAHGLSYFVACGILVPPPGIAPLSSASQDGFLTIGPPGQSLLHLFLLTSQGTMWAHNLSGR